MTYSSAEARQELIDSLTGAIDELAYALAALGAAYEQLDDYSAEKLEEDLFGPVQKAYGRAQRTQAQFAQRHGLTIPTFEPQESGLPSTGAKGFIDNAVEAVGAADIAFAGVQDAPSFVEVGDMELRAGLAQVRELIGKLPSSARELTRRLGR